MRNSQKVTNGHVLVTNNDDTAYFVENTSKNGNMSILNLETMETERVSKTFANSCMVFEEI